MKKYLLAGLLVWLPMALTIWLLHSVLGLMDGVFGFLRTAGPSLSPFNAWVILKGMETLELRMLAQSARALELARWLERHPKVAYVVDLQKCFGGRCRVRTCDPCRVKAVLYR